MVEHTTKENADKGEVLHSVCPVLCKAREICE